MTSNELRQRRNGSSNGSKSIDDSRNHQDVTMIPMEGEDASLGVLAGVSRESSSNLPTRDGAADDTADASVASPNGIHTATPGPRSAMSGTQVHKDESKKRKILVRVVYGFGLFGVFSGSVWMGHMYICLLVALIELLLFRELVRVRYSAYFDTIQDTIPLFRTTQWLWFTVAIFYTYGDFVLEIITRNTATHYLLRYAQYSPSIAFILYSGTFVVTITTLQRDHIKFQINQCCWTILVLCLTVGQLKYVMHNIFNGLIWFVMPCCLVFCNDIMAYVSGMLYGRKFIQRHFLSISPNKTWEGFIGGCFFTVIASWYLGRFLAQFTWMTCPTNEFSFLPQSLECQLDPIFEPAQSFVPPQIFELIPRQFVKMLPLSVVEICSEVKKNGTTLTRCISGEESQVHDHFELTFKNFYPIQVHAVWLALFASLVAPFGGFLASAIKRAYGIKDFDSIIPGHGGVMDRMDWYVCWLVAVVSCLLFGVSPSIVTVVSPPLSLFTRYIAPVFLCAVYSQFLMALCTWVHYNTFVKLATVSVPKLTYMYSLLSEQEKKDFLESISIGGGKFKMKVSDFAFN